MKRTEALAGLSREHHGALVMAQRIAAGALSPADLGRRFDRELNPHFLAEERFLLPFLERAGAAALAERTRREHDEMRRLAAAVEEGDADALASFGIALREHVRFEERELFVAVEALLKPESLRELGQCLAASS